MRSERDGFDTRLGTSTTSGTVPQPRDISRRQPVAGGDGVSRALLVGIDEYQHHRPLSGCAADASALELMLARHEDGTPNFACRLAVGAVAREDLLGALDALLAPGADFALFYFAGHGGPAHGDLALVTADGQGATPGVQFREVLDHIALSPVREVVIILDCCFSGGAGTLALLDGSTAVLRRGVSILTASRGDQAALESAGRGLFSSYLEAALDGGAADILGHVTVASVYAFLSESFGAWEQRPTFKANVERLHDLRRCHPAVTLKTLRALTSWFPTPEHVFPLDPGHEPEALPRDPAKEEIFARLQECRASKLIEPVGHQHMYYAAILSGGCRLTALGRHYWHLSDRGYL
jgi:Caspase domain